MLTVCISSICSWICSVNGIECVYIFSYCGHGFAWTLRGSLYRRLALAPSWISKGPLCGPCRGVEPFFWKVWLGLDCTNHYDMATVLTLGILPCLERAVMLSVSLGIPRCLDCHAETVSGQTACVLNVFTVYFNLGWWEQLKSHHHHYCYIVKTPVLCI